MKYRVLGRTGLSVGEIGFGCEGMVEHPEWTEDFIDVMEAHGANCIDLYAPHPDFRDALGKALQGRRDKFVLQAHLCTIWKDGQYKRTRDIEDVKAGFADQLQRLQTDHLEVGMVHYVDSLADWKQILDGDIMKYAVSLKEAGVIASIGHSGATFEEARMAIANGARSMTHIFNGMTPFHHRNPGLVGAAMRFRDTYGEVICDGNHSNVNSLNNLFMAKGRDYTIMITDALMVKGLPVGTKVLFGGNEIELYEDGSAHLTSTKGLAGSTLKVNMGLKVLVEKAMVPWDYAINSCTLNPARLLGIDSRKGAIRAGNDADIVVLNDDYSVETTYARGKVVYEKQ